MTIQTDAQLQTELDTNEGGVLLSRRIRIDTTHESIYVTGSQKYPGQCVFADVDPTSTAATQGALILAKLRL